MPSWFVDRSLGSRAVPQGLRDAGWTIETMDERYGPARSQDILDADWIADAARRDDVLLTSDRKIGKIPVQAYVIRAVSARIVVVDANLTAASQVERLTGRAPQILALIEHREGPWIVSAGAVGLRELRLGPPSDAPS